MSIKGWLKENTASLRGKTVALTGSTGGLGRELANYLASLGATLVLLDRNRERSERVRAELEEKHGALASCVTLDLSDMESVRRATAELIKIAPDVFIHNAGAYAIPRYKTSEGFDVVFAINFMSPYYIIRELLQTLREKNGRVVVVSSIAHNYSRYDPSDVDFSTRGKASLVYGNAKRYLTYATEELFSGEEQVSLAVAHPGISKTGITDHYPRLIYALIKHPMKLIFMRPKKASLSILKGVFAPTEYGYWIGPRLFNVWGMPKIKRLRSAEAEERRAIGEIADRLYKRIKKGEEDERV